MSAPLSSLIVPGAHVMRLGVDMSPPGHPPNEQRGVVLAVKGGRARIVWQNEDGTQRKTWLSLSSLGRRWTWLHGPTGREEDRS